MLNFLKNLFKPKVTEEKHPLDGPIRAAEEKVFKPQFPEPSLPSIADAQKPTETPAPVAAPAPVINIQNNNTQQQSNGGKTVIIKEKEATAKPVTPKKKTEKEQLEEAPAW